MNRSIPRPFLATLFLATLFWATLSLVTVGWAATRNSARELLDDYRRATTALTQSVEVFASDQVESLDALRRAKAAFAPLAAELEPPLRQGLATTFESAEAAIGNRSETDLRVQAAVLRGGFQRSLYGVALESASADQPRARELLSVLATDLGMTETTFGGASLQGLQTAFEGRLAALSLKRLERLGDDRESRYETLAGVYGHVFLVQDSPRLPEQTQATLLSAIQALVTDKPLAPPLATLRAQLSEFERAARSSQNASPASITEVGPPTTTPNAPTGNGVTAGEAALGRAAPGAADKGAADKPGDALAEIDIAPELTPEPAATPAADTATTAADTATANADVDAATTDKANTATPPAPADGVQPAPLTPAAPPNAVTAPLSPNVQLISGLREPLLLVSGALALVGFLGLLFSRRSPTPWRDAALALLLLPAIAEGLIALAPYATPLLEPYMTLPNLGSYSLFANPLTQLVWTTLTVLAALCLMLSWRAPGAASRSRSASKVPAATPASAPVTEPPVAAPDRNEGTGHAPVQAFPRSSSTLTTGSGFDWDEDF